MHGLPWTNPLKLQVSSDEHIIDTTINRGLMQLLNNDYYLDMKNDILSKELSTVVKNVDIILNALDSHVVNTDLHHTSQTTVQEINENSINISNVVNLTSTSSSSSDKLEKDTIKYLSIGWNAAKIQDVIDNVPHDLNGFTLLFLFVVPESYECENEHEYVLNLDNDNISFNNFHHGNLVVMGYYLHDDDYFGQFNENTFRKSIKAISDPETYDNLNISKFITKFESSLECPERIEDITSFEADKEKYYDHDADLNKIIIKGSGLNQNYSVVSFIGNTANIKVKNISFESSLSPTLADSDDIDISDFSEKTLPKSESLIAFYPFMNDFKPILDDSFSNIVKNDIAFPILSSLGLYTNTIDYYIEGGEITSDDETYDELSEDLSGVVSSVQNGLLTELDILLERLNSDNISSLLMSEPCNLTYKNSIKLIDDLNNKFDDLKIKLNNVKGSMDNFDSSNYIDKSNKFQVSLCISDLNEYVTNVSEIISSITTSLLQSINFHLFVRTLIDLYVDDETAANPNSSISIEDGFNLYYNKCLNNYIVGLTAEIGKISNKILFKLENSVLNFNSDDFKFIKSYAFILFDSISQSTYDSKISKDSTGNVAVHFDKNTADTNEYLLLDEDEESLTNKYVSKLIFDPTFKTELENNDYKTTLCFWSKLNTNEISLDDTAFLGFKFGSSETCNLTINPTSIHSIKLDESGELNDLKIDILDSPIIYKTYKNDWIFWEIQLDLSKFTESSTITFNINAHTYDYDSKYQKYNVLSNESIELPLSSSVILNEDFNMYIGYNDYLTSNDSNKNVNHYNGYLRNLMIFRCGLTAIESKSLFEEGIKELYGLKSQYYESPLKNIISNENFFIGLVGSYDNTSINIINCIMKHNGKELHNLR